MWGGGDHQWGASSRLPWAQAAPCVWGEECRGRQRGCYSSKWLICPNVQMLVLVVELIFGSQHPFVNAICIFSWCENWWFTPLQHVTLLLQCLSVETKHDKNQIFNPLRIRFRRQVHLLFSIFRSTEGAHYSPCEAFNAQMLKSYDKPESKFQVLSYGSEDEVSLCPILFL